MILDLPPQLEQAIIAQAKAQGISTQELAVATLQQQFAPDEEQAYYDWFYRHHFDIERLKEAIGETDENGRPKHTLALPRGLNKEQLSAWLKENIPAYLENRELT